MGTIAIRKTDWNWMQRMYGIDAGLEGFGRYPVFTAVFTGKYRPGKNRFWTPKVGKTGKNTTSALFKQFSTSIKDLIGPWNIETQELIILIYIQMVYMAMHYSVSDFSSSFIYWFWQHVQHKYIFSLICNFNIQNAHAVASFISTNEWMFLRNSILWQKYLNRGVFNPEPQHSCRMLCHLEWILTYPCARRNKVSRTQCYKGLDLWSCNQLLVIQFCTSYWCLKIRLQFCTWFVLWGKVRTNCIRRRIMAKIWVHKIWVMSFSQFWTVFPSFGREKLGKTGLSQFIPFWTGKTGFGREKPNPV